MRIDAKYSRDGWANIPTIDITAVIDSLAAPWHNSYTGG